jgi:hypothetical protein
MKTESDTRDVNWFPYKNGHFEICNYFYDFYDF